MQEITIQELSAQELDAVSGARGISAVEGAGLILGLTTFALASPIVVGVGLGAAGGLLIAHLLA